MTSEENLFKTDTRGSIIYDESGIEVINFKTPAQNNMDGQTC